LGALAGELLASARACSFDNMPSIYLLPVVANVVNAALGGMVGAQTDDEARAMWILFSSLVELGCGLFSGMRAPYPYLAFGVGCDKKFVARDVSSGATMTRIIH
jgi:hypothetical protein